MDIKKLYIDEIALVQNQLLENIEKNRGRSLYTQATRQINEALVTIDKVLDADFLQPHDRILLEKTFAWGHDDVHMNLQYFNAYYYAKDNIVKGGFSQQLALTRVNEETASMLTTILAFNRSLRGLGGSTDDYFVNRMPRALWAVKYLYHRKLEGLYLPSLYVLVNFQQSLTEYLFCTDTQYRPGAIQMLTEVTDMLYNMLNSEEASRILQQNLQLQLFFITQQIRVNKALGTNHPVELTDITSLPDTKPESKLRILTSVYLLNEGRFRELFESALPTLKAEIQHGPEGLNNILFLRCLAFYCNPDPEFSGIELRLNPMQEKTLNLRTQMKNMFRLYEEAAAETVSESELKMLMGYDDNTLRDKVANVVLGVDKFQLDREKIKPHGPAEISDMELRISLDQETYYLCMPFKSGIEIASSTVPEKIVYQILKPFTYLNKAVVVFITAKRCSQNLMAYIKRIEDKLGWPIAVIENEELAKLLKINGQLN